MPILESLRSYTVRDASNIIYILKDLNFTDALNHYIVAIMLVSENMFTRYNLRSQIADFLLYIFGDYLLLVIQIRC